MLLVALAVPAVPSRAQSKTVPAGQGAVTVHQLRAPERARHEVELARAAVRKQDIPAARRHLGRALAAYPGYSVALTMRAVLEMNAGEREPALADLLRAIDADPDYAAAYIVLASAYNDDGRFADALAVLERARRRLAAVWQTHFETARALLGRGQAAEALPEVTRALQLMTSAERASNRALVHFVRAEVLAGLHDFAGARGDLEASVALEPQGEYAAYSRQMLASLPPAAAR